MSMVSKLGSKLVLLVSGRIALLVLGLAATAILTRLLGPTGFGHYRAAVAYLGLVVVLADFGLGSIFVRQISREGADQSRIVSNALALRLAVASLTFLIAIGLAYLVPFDSSARLGILGGAAGFVAYSAHLMLFGLFQQRLRQQGAILAEVAGGLALLGMIWLFSRLGAHPAWFVAALGASYVVTLIISLWFARRLLRFRLRIEWTQWQELIRSALPLAGAGTLLVLYIRADSVLLALLQTPEAVGLYGVPIKIFDSLMGITLLFVGLIAPLLARSAHSESDDFNQVLSTSLGTAFVGSIGIALGLSAIAEEIVTLLAGPAFAASADILRLLTVLFIMHTASLLLREAAVALDVQKRLVPVYLGGMIVAFAAYLFLIPRYAGLGAAVSLILAESLVLAGILVVVSRRMPRRPAAKMPVGAAISGGLAAAALFVAFYLGWGWQARIGCAAAAYLTVLFLTRTITPSMLASAVRDMTGRSQGN